MSALFLCGFMGCGKSTIGHKLAAKLRQPCIDLDAYIIEKENRSIPDIFSQSGEAYFRALEADCLTELAERPVIIATGGGTLLNEATVRTARKHGTIFFLDTPFQVCWGRIAGDTNRPLVMKHSREELRELFNQRRVIYRKHSDFTVSGAQSLKNIVEDIVRRLPAESHPITESE